MYRKFFYMIMLCSIVMPGLLAAENRGDAFSENTAEAAGNKKDSSWVTSTTLGLKLTQVSFTNWATGGDNALAFEASAIYQADYKKNKHIWQNRIELAYGLNKSGSDGLKKTNDKIYLNSNYGYEITKNLYLSALLNFQTQFSNGYDYAVSNSVPISKFMAPGYLTIGPGITWIPKPYFKLIFSPATWRGTFVLNDSLSNAGSFGVDPGKKVLNEFGANLKLEVKYEFLKNMTVYSRVDFYSDYLRKPLNIDVNWEVQLNMQINKWFSATFTTNLIYDDDIKITQPDGSNGPRVQFKELLAVGFQYTF